MKYKVIQKANPSNLEAPRKWYASPVKRGVITKAEIATDISGRSSLTRGDISNVIENLLDLLPKYLKEGNSVKFGDLGTFRLSFGSEGVESKEQFTVDKIKNTKVLFTPGTLIKKELSDIKFEKTE